MNKTVGFVIPCFNEEEVLPIVSKTLEEKVNQLKQKFNFVNNYKIFFVDDGSSDKTWQIISELHAKNNLFCGVKLSKNKGHQNALLSGLMTAKESCDAVISMDADLQDDVDAVDKMIEMWWGGYEIVFGVRSSRETDTFFKRFTAQSFYKILSTLSDNPKNIIYNHADYRLMSKRAIKSLSEFSEVNLFLRGIIPDIGLKQGIVYYKRNERAAGTSKYPLKKMLSFAIQGITSLSVKPMKIITGIGFTLFSISIVLSIYFLIRHFTGHTVQGWSTLACSIWGIGGILQMSIGVIGEYIGKIYLETKHRPKYFIEEVLE